MLNPVERANIFNRARALLVSHWIDLGRVDLRLGGQSLILAGNLRRIENFEQKLTSEIVTSIMDDLRRIPGVRFLQTELENWTETRGTWVPVQADGVTVRTSTPTGFGSHAGGGDPNVYRIRPDGSPEDEPGSPPNDAGGPS